jgi:ribA/ribD-fused uncharacterized protein
MIDSFRGKYRFLSNFWPCEVVYDNITFQSTEHAFQAAKTTNPMQIARILVARTPGEAKKIGSEVELRSDWITYRYVVMLDLQRQKYQIPELREKLRETKDHYLVEGNTWHDNTWGNCICPKCFYIEGENMLGKLIMQVRSENG